MFHIARFGIHLEVGLPLGVLLHRVAFALALRHVGVGPQMNDLVERPDLGGGEHHGLADVAQLDRIGVLFVHRQPGVLQAGLEGIDAQVEYHDCSVPGSEG